MAGKALLTVPTIDPSARVADCSLGAYTEVITEAPMPIAPPRGGLADRLRGLLEAGSRAIPAPLQVGRRDEPPAREDV